ncbi:MAG: hypothetical protein KIT09_08955 [Bryobacteraceae bacterium]|nr:hypothetical protein [Bryobacteraceae bacterium]
MAVAALAATSAQAAGEPACRHGIEPPGTLWAAADFDGDDSVDLARVTFQRARDGIVASTVELFPHCRNSLPPIPGAFPYRLLVLSVRDLDADDDPDLVLREPFAGRALGIWLNDGSGGFVPAEPGDFPGAGGDAWTFEKRGARDRAPAPSSVPKSGLSAPPGTDMTPAPRAGQRPGGVVSRMDSRRLNSPRTRAPPVLSS